MSTGWDISSSPVGCPGCPSLRQGDSEHCRRSSCAQGGPRARKLACLCSQTGPALWPGFLRSGVAPHMRLPPWSLYCLWGSSVPIWRLGTGIGAHLKLPPSSHSWPSRSSLLVLRVLGPISSSLNNLLRAFLSSGWIAAWYHGISGWCPGSSLSHLPPR